MKARTRPTIVTVLLIAVGLLWGSSAFAAEWDRFPDPRAHVGIKKRFDGPKYTDLRRCLRGLDSRVDADYFAGLVDITDEEGSRSRQKKDARPYADALFEEWKLDESQDVLIVVGIRNRSLGVRPGEKWQKLGLDERTIDETVDASDFEKYRRRGDYGDAICSLATALDYRLAALDQAMKRRIESISSRLPTLEEEHSALVDRVDETFPDKHTFGDATREKLTLAEQFLTDAESTLEDDPAKAVNLADNAVEAMDDVRDRLQNYKREADELDDIATRIKSLERQIEGRPDVDREGPREALEMLEECRATVEATRETLETDPSTIRVCIADVESRLARADVHHEYRSEVFPTIITVAAGVLALVIIVALFLRRRRMMRWLRPEFTAWERDLDDLGGRLDTLAQRFPVYFGSRAPWSGDSADADRTISDHTARAAILRERASSLLGEAKDAASSVIPLAILGPQKALRLLRESAIRLEPGDQPAQSQLGTKISEAHETRSSDILGDAYRALVDGVQRLEDIARTLDDVRAQKDRASELNAAVRDAQSRRQSLGLPMLDIQQRVDELSTAYERTTKLAKQDPLGAQQQLEDLAERLDALESRLQAASEAYERVTEHLRERGEALRNRVRELKRKGQAVEEPGFSPAAELDSAARLAERIQMLAERGHGHEALERTHELEDELTELESLIEVSEQADDVVPVALDAIKQQRDALKSDILKVRVAIGRHQEESGDSNGYMARISDLQSSLSDRALHLNRIQRAMHKGRVLTAAADTARTVDHLERGKNITQRIAGELGVEPESLETPQVAWPDAWRQSALAQWSSQRFGSAGSSDLLW